MIVSSGYQEHPVVEAEVKNTHKSSCSVVLMASYFSQLLEDFPHVFGTNTDHYYIKMVIRQVMNNYCVVL